MHFDDLRQVAWIVPVCAITGALTLTVIWMSARLFKGKMMRQNFKGHLIPVCGGVAIVITGLFFGGLLYCDHSSYTNDRSSFQVLAFICALGGFGALGLQDDLFGNRNAGGFRQHFRQLFINKRITTGVVKAIGGAFIGIIAGYILTERTLFVSATNYQANLMSGSITATLTVLLYGILIALTANTFNLTDLRPGRCLSISVLLTMIGVIACLAIGQFQTLNIFFILLGITIPIYVFDRSGKIMLGDTGSNALGAAVAVCYICLMKRWEVAIVVLLLAAFQIWCEKHSLSAFIESHPLLRSLDRKIGVR